MFEFLFGPKRPEPPLCAQDPVLGTLLYRKEFDSWMASVDVGGKRIDVEVTGATSPNPVLVQHARELVQNYSAFERGVSDLLDAEAAAAREPEATEIRSLIIESVDFPVA